MTDAGVQRSSLQIFQRMRPAWFSADSGAVAALVTVAAWLVVCLLYVLLLQYTDRGPTSTQPIWGHWLVIFLSFSPLMIVSAGLAIFYARKTEWMLSPVGLASVGLALLFVLLPLMETVAVLVILWVNNQPFSNFFAKMHNRGAFIWWIHGCIIMLAFVAQAAIASLRRTRAQEQAWQQQQTEKLALRLRLLQGQLKPHFLFNALNGISALVRTADRTLACNALAQLQDLLRYAVNASNQDWLSVADEIGFIRDYLDLQMLRYGERLSIDWEIDDLVWQRLSCAPLLFQPLVENAIHHGVENHHDRCRLVIRLALALDTVRLVVENPLIDTKRTQKKHNGHGVGLSATRERLRLLYQDEAQLSTLPHTTQQVVVTTLQFPARPFYER